jgi:hypothetical protein
VTLVDRPGTAYDTTMSYDPSDNRTQTTNSYVNSSLLYDAASRLASRQDVMAGGTATLTTSYGYDGNDNLRQITYPSGNQINYTHDAENRISTVKLGATNIATAFTYHPSGGIDTYLAGNGLTHDADYNNRYRVKTVNTLNGVTSNILRLDYTYSPVGNVDAISETTRTGMNQSFTYDALDRVQTASGPWGASSFAYNAIGDRTSKTVAGATTNYSYAAATNRLTGASGAEPETFGYDSSGDMTSNAGGTYTYTADKMMETAVVAGTTVTYRYDADNLRKLKIQGSTRRYFLHDAQGQAISEFDELCPGSGLQHVRDYVFAGGRLLAAVRPLAPLAVTVGFATAASTAAEGIGSIPVGVRVSTSSGVAIPCAVSVNYGSANGTAVAPADYASISGTLSFAAGTPSGTVQNILLPIVQDALDEDDETVTLTMSSASGAQLGQALHTVTIADDDLPPALSVADVTVTEGDTGSVNAVFTLSLSAASGRTVSVNYATANGTAIAGSDYTGGAGTATFAPGETSHARTVAVLGDLIDEPTQTFFVNLSGPVNATLADGQAVGTILDNDPPPTISIEDAAVIETNGGSATVSLPVALSVPSDFTVTVNYATSNGTALTGSDYTASSGVVSFTPGTTSRGVIVDVLGDQAKEPNETFLVTLSGVVQGTIGDGQATGTILDDEPDDYLTVVPCRLVDTRITGPALAANTTRLFAAVGLCGIPLTAKAIAVNVTVVSPTAQGSLLVYPARIALPLARSLNFDAGINRGNNAVVTLGSDGQVAVQCTMASGSTDLVIDVFGYFE